MAKAPNRYSGQGAVPEFNSGRQKGNVAPFICLLCRLDFSTQRALCGHMNAPMNRGWRDMNPPPGVKIEDFTEYEFEPEDAETSIFGGGPMVNEAATREQEDNKPFIPDLNKSPPQEK